MLELPSPNFQVSSGWGPGQTHEFLRKNILELESYTSTLQNYIRIDGFYGVQAGVHQQYFYLGRAEGVWQIFRSEEKNTWAFQLTFFQEGVQSFSVSPDGRLIAVEINRKGSEHNPLALVDAQTGRWDEIFDEPGALSNCFLWNPDSLFFIFRSNFENLKDFKLYRHSIQSGKRDKILDSEGWVTPLDFSPSGNKLLYSISHSNADNDLYTLDLKKLKEITHLTPHHDDTYYQAVFAGDDEQFFVLGNEKQNFSSLKFWNLTKNCKTDFGEKIPFELSSLKISKDRRYLAFLSNGHGYDELYILDTLTGFNQHTPEFKGVINNFCFDHENNLLLTYEYHKRPSLVYHWHLRAKNLKQLTWANFFGLNPQHFREPEFFSFQSFDNLEIPGYLYLPPGFKKGANCPFILFFHGGPEGQFCPSFHKHFQYFLSRGYGVCAPNIRGSGGYGREFMALDNYLKRPDSIKDGLQAAHYLINEGYSTKGNLAVYGGSYGGFMVLSLISEEPNLFTAAISVVGISNLVTFLKNTGSYRRKLREKEYGPLTDEPFLHSISPIHKIHDTQTPLLLIHGATDPRVPLDEAKQVESILIQNQKSVRLVVFEDEGHGIKKTGNFAVYLQEMSDFLDHHLKKMESHPPVV